jgi:hypothetical protein
MHRFALPGHVAAVLGSLLLAACLGPDPSCAGLPTQVDVTLTADAMTPSNPELCRDTDAVLRVSSEVDGVFHIHGLDDQVPATTVTAGDVVELAFSPTRSGQFPVELHTQENTQGVNVGLLTVHEP